MQCMVLVVGLGTQGKNVNRFNESIAEKENEGWEVVDMQTTSAAFGSQPELILRLAKEAD